MQKLTSPIVSSCTLQSICPQSLVLYARVYLWQGTWEAGWGPYALGVKIKCMSVYALNTFQRDRVKEGQWTPLFVLNINYSGEDYNLTSVEKKPKQRKTLYIQPLYANTAFWRKERESWEQTSIKMRFQCFNKDPECCILCDHFEINRLNIKM